METLQIQTSSREEMVSISKPLRRLVSEKGWSDGVLFLHCPHTTGAVTINEGADPYAKGAKIPNAVFSSAS